MVLVTLGTRKGQHKDHEKQGHEKQGQVFDFAWADCDLILIGYFC